jgi:hypothetical protein
LIVILLAIFRKMIVEWEDAWSFTIKKNKFNCLAS